MAAKSKSKGKPKKKSTPILYSSNIEWIEDVIMTGVTAAGVIEPYTYWTAYGVEVPILSPNDVLHLNAQAEVTNPWQFNVQVDGAFANGSTYGGNTFNLVGLPNCGWKMDLQDTPLSRGLLMVLLLQCGSRLRWLEPKYSIVVNN